MNFVGLMLSFSLAGVGFFYLIQDIAFKKSFRSVEVYFLRPYYVCSLNPFSFGIYTSAAGSKVFIGSVLIRIGLFLISDSPM